MRWIDAGRITAARYRRAMPELSRFHGIVIRMFAEAGAGHHIPHFHAYYQEHAAVFAFNPVVCIGGNLPARQAQLVTTWAEVRREELHEAWSRLEEGRAPNPIVPI